MLRPSYSLVLVGIVPEAAGCAALRFATAPAGHELSIRLQADEAQTLAVELAGLTTPRSRVVQTLGQMLAQLGAQLHNVQLRRTTGNTVEAAISYGSAIEQQTLSVGVGVGVGVALALAHAAPISGDESLWPLLRPSTFDASAQPEAEVDVDLPPSIASFIDSLSD